MGINPEFCSTLAGACRMKHHSNSFRIWCRRNMVFNVKTTTTCPPQPLDIDYYLVSLNFSLMPLRHFFRAQVYSICCAFAFACTGHPDRTRIVSQVVHQNQDDTVFFVPPPRARRLTCHFCHTQSFFADQHAVLQVGHRWPLLLRLSISEI